METMNWGKGLPPDIGMTIFSELVISDLPTCRLVCKTWNAVILDYASSSKFLTNDFIFSVCDEVPNSKFRNVCNPKMHCLRFDNLDVDFNDLELEGNKSASFDGDWSLITVLGYCNGLLFICKSNNGYTMCHGIFNPMTNEFFQLPEIFEDIYAFGLGYIPTTKQYKLFRVTHTDFIASGTQQEPSCIIEVFHFSEINSKKNQWRPLHSLPYYDIEDCGVYMNGVIYWLGKEINRKNEYVIYALDVETEKIELSAILEVGPVRDSSNSNIQQFNGSVYAIIYIDVPTTHRTIQVWRMQEKDTWIREFVIDDVSKDWSVITLIKVYENGEILCKVSLYTFCLYNPFTGRKKIITKTQNKFLTAICQIESLNFGSLPNILAGEESRMMRTTSKLMRSKRRLMRSILVRIKRRLMRSISRLC